MKFIEKTKEQGQIEIGDLVCYNGNICLVIHILKAYTVSGDIRYLEFPFILVNLNSGIVETAFKELEILNKSKNIRLLAKNKDVEIHY